MQPMRSVRSKTMALPLSNVDTDQIIPARFLTTTTKEGLGRQLFSDWRYRADGTPKRSQSSTCHCCSRVDVARISAGP